ncbi:response regulator with CheY-like receiver domain and winged-helix DNA-binding domain [Desulfosporosinus acidiphilus SJ4]|uniref:Stage 0 sporulation protein A homolog n=1 Tax=Desulfosporosinus acidiphilus (strain DSM 22704 / JCM 16185 / SJ4) TaxID=646529 RepID=I4D1P4_DESAJ|nr:response regulator with CheY-like receiver domain and winged-helix DNA-binding domain [Desulfosporosinus acidiphilus SJ4]
MIIETIVVAEDDDSIRKFLSILLTREGFDVKVVERGTEVITECRISKPDLLLLDIMMPGMDGFEVCRNIRKESNLPIIILTARENNEDKISGLILGCDDYITKPFDSTELVLRIKAVLRRAKEHSKPENERNIVELPGMTINNTSRITEVKGKVVDLTPKEYALLWLLANRPEQVFTREQLLDQIWDVDYYGSTSVVTSLVKRLREKIEPDVSNQYYIKTIHGVGYKLGVKPL